MNKTKEELQALVDQATAGDKKALETLVTGVHDILLKVITHLSSFRGDSLFTTWVFSIAVNYLKSYRKHMFAGCPLSFEYYGDDIENRKMQNVPDLTQNVETELLAEELKMSCTNVMLQCLDVESRCIFILGTMFKLDSRIAGDILAMTPEAYRQRLSRIRKKMADFLGQYCGEYGGGKCKCKDRVNYAIQNHRINPLRLDYIAATEIPIETITDVKNAMDEIDDLSQDFSFCKPYQSPERTKHLIQEFLDSTQLSVIQNS